MDYICKPFEPDEALIRVKTHLTNARLTKALRWKNTELEQEIERREHAEDALRTADEHLSIISEQETKRWAVELNTQSEIMVPVIEDIRLLQQNSTTSVLITGESGTGKEVIARAIHSGGPRKDKPFVDVNCTSISKTLAESELFGHVRGAFTGADKDKTGYFDRANGGTLFLDEIGDMPLEMQPKLLRVLAEGSFTPVGGVDTPVDVRILCATNVNLDEKIASGEFRKDLFYRLAVFLVSLPPLRDRMEDIPLLVRHFLDYFADDMRRENPKLGEEALTVLKSYHFPGNIRELKNIIERALIKSGSATIQPEHLHVSFESDAVADPTGEKSFAQKILSREMGYSEVVTAFERQVITQVLSACDGKRSKAAELLQIYAPNLTRLIKRLEIDDAKVP